MRNVLALLLLVHGLAHVAGLLSLWGVAPGNAASRRVIVLWLAVAAAFVTIAVGLWRDASWSIAAAIVTCMLSLVMTLAWSPSARIGAAVNSVVLAALLIVGLKEFRASMRLATERVSGSSIVMTPAGPIEVAIVGEGTPLLALHGTAGGWDQALRSASGFTRFGYRVIAPSRFGYLRTPQREDASPMLEADTWVSLLDALHLERVAVMSWSAGAAPAAQLALRHPDRVSKLVFFVPGAGGIADPAPGPPIWVVDAVFKWNFPIWVAQRLMPAMMLGWVAVPASLVPTLGPRERAELDFTIAALFPVSARHDGMLYDARSQSGAFGRFPIERIGAPSLWISAEDDLYGTLRVAKHAAGVIPNATLIRYKTGGHLLLGHADDFWPRIDRFFREPLPEGDRQ